MQDNSTTTDNKNQYPSRRELLEQTTISRLPRLPKRESFLIPNKPSAPTAIICLACGGRLETDNDFQQSLMVCRKCLSLYAKIETAFDEKEKRERKQVLEKMFGGAK